MLQISSAMEPYFLKSPVSTNVIGVKPRLHDNTIFKKYRLVFFNYMDRALPIASIVQYQQTRISQQVPYALRPAQFPKR